MSAATKTREEIAKMRVAGKLASEVLDFITPYVKPGITTNEIDRLCHDYMVNEQSRSALQ
jgi:methionyl aminopeptidase